MIYIRGLTLLLDGNTLIPLTVAVTTDHELYDDFLYNVSCTSRDVMLCSGGRGILGRNKLEVSGYRRTGGDTTASFGPEARGVLEGNVRVSNRYIVKRYEEL